MSTLTTNYSFVMPDKTDLYDIDQYNSTIEQVDTLLEIAQENFEAAVLAASEATTASASCTSSLSLVSTLAYSAEVAANTAETAAAEAQTAYENTIELTTDSLGDVTFSINAAKGCLTAYIASDEDVDITDWYTEFLALLSEYANEADEARNVAVSSMETTVEAMETAVAASEQAASQVSTITNAAETATVAATTAQYYYEATLGLSVATVGEILFAINEQKDCLTATYDADLDDDEYNITSVTFASDDEIDTEIAKFEE